ncbi:hypothetical protein FHU29_003292 [Hoyosella altamirensis]|uniref:Uncharacterized protein n=1 Tax=Hoyosella altamirensis TaxID=616997 RepID=A0A839RSA9_9ACTN|nr:hypothetical protein [Hoyosella altamirensis]
MVDHDQHWTALGKFVVQVPQRGLVLRQRLVVDLLTCWVQSVAGCSTLPTSRPRNSRYSVLLIDAPLFVRLVDESDEGCRQARYEATNAKTPCPYQRSIPPPAPATPRIMRTTAAREPYRFWRPGPLELGSRKVTAADRVMASLHSE